MAPGPTWISGTGTPPSGAACSAIYSEQGIVDTVALGADIHVSMAAEVHERSYEKPIGEPLAVEFVSPSLTSQNLADKLKLPRHNPTSRQAEEAFVHTLDHVHWCDMDSHGYVVVDVDPTARHGRVVASRHRRRGRPPRPSAGRSP